MSEQESNAPDQTKAFEMASKVVEIASDDIATKAGVKINSITGEETVTDDGIQISFTVAHDGGAEKDVNYLQGLFEGRISRYMGPLGREDDGKPVSLEFNMVDGRVPAVDPEADTVEIEIQPVDQSADTVEIEIRDLPGQQPKP